MQSYTFNDSAHAARLFGLKEFGNIYSRLMNVSVFRTRPSTQCTSAGLAIVSEGSESLHDSQ